MKNIESAYKADNSKVPTQMELDEILAAAQEFGVKVVWNDGHPGLKPWDVRHLHFGEARIHIPLPEGFVMPAWIPKEY